MIGKKPYNKTYLIPESEWYPDDEDYEDDVSRAYFRLMEMFHYNYENTFNDFPLDENELLFKTNLEEEIRIKEKEILINKIEKRNKYHREYREKFKEYWDSDKRLYRLKKNQKMKHYTNGRYNA